jgi:hypothetical protein
VEQEDDQREEDPGKARHDDPCGPVTREGEIAGLLHAGSEPGQRDPALAHIFARAVGIADLAGLVAFQEQELAGAFVRIDLGGQGVVLLNSSVTCPSQPGSSGVTFTMMPQRA